jgi:class 3 adenylate cyclase/tetratricopeptide (TPR) repeat protein
MSESGRGDIADWLKKLGLGQYFPIFVDNAIDFETLSRTTDDELKDLGLLPAHRKILLSAVSRLTSPNVAENTPEMRLRLQLAATTKAERRQLTAMFSDLVGSTELSSLLDPEDLREVIRLYQATCGDAIRPHGGFIAQYQGDGIVVYFGYPSANEDDAERAVRAGLDILRAVSKLNTSGGTKIEVRLGIATGLTVVGDLIGQGASAVTEVAGQPPNLAARLQAFAAPGTIVIADSTKKLAGGLFEYDDLGQQRFKGIHDEVHVWRVVGERDHAIRYEAMRGSRSGKVVDRSKEMALLNAAWEQAQAGDGRVVLLSGDAGIGKSCLLHCIGNRIAEAEAIRVPLQCSAHHRDSPLYPLIIHLQRAAGFERADMPDVKLGKIERLLAAESADEGTPLVAALLSVPYTDRYPPLAMPAQRQKALTLALLAKQLVALSERKPVLMLVEDAHWMDPTTEELSSQLVDLLPNKRVLAIVAARPEYRPPWTNRSHVSTVQLGRLQQRHVKQLIEVVSRGKQLPSAMTDQILVKTDGVPLFVEELTKTVLESGVLRETCDGYVLDRSLPPLAIPSTLHDSLVSRLDRMGPVKTIAQVGAAIGRKFSFAMLASVTRQPHDQLSDALDRLVAAELIFARGKPSETEYTFKHALVQDAAYESLLRARKKSLHQQIAEAIETSFPEMMDGEPETLAHHWTRADIAYKAIGYWLRAGQRAVARSSNLEAIRHLSNGIDLLDRLPKDAARGLLEFNLYLALGQAFYVAKGPAAAETSRAYTRAQELVIHVKDPEQRFALLYGIFSGYHFASRFALAEGPAKRVLALAKRDGDAGHMCQAHRMLGYICFFRGDSKGALKHFHELAELYDPDAHGRLAFRYGADCLVAARGFQVVIDGVSGRPDSALRMAQDNIAYARRLGHPATLGWAFASAGYLNFFLREPEATLQVTTDGIRFCEENNVAAWAIHCRVFNTWARARKSSAGGCVEDIRRAMVGAGAGIALGLPLFRGVLADVLMAAGEPAEALMEADGALSDVASTGQYFFEPDLHQIRAECLLGLRQQDEGEVVSCLRRSIASARQIGAKMLELRAATKLAQLESTEDNATTKSRAAVAKLYSQFAEGFEAPDLRAARKFLAASQHDGKAHVRRSHRLGPA